MKKFYLSNEGHLDKIYSLMSKDPEFVWNCKTPFVRFPFHAKVGFIENIMQMQPFKKLCEENDIEIVKDAHCESGFTVVKRVGQEWDDTN